MCQLALRDLVRTFQGKSSYLNGQKGKKLSSAKGAIGVGPSPIASGMPTVADLYETTATLGLGSRNPTDAPSRSGHNTSG